MQVEEESTFEPIEKLQQFGINASDIQKLKDGGYYTIGMVLKTPQKVLQWERAETQGFGERQRTERGQNRKDPHRRSHHEGIFAGILFCRQSACFAPEGK